MKPGDLVKVKFSIHEKIFEGAMLYVQSPSGRMRLSDQPWVDFLYSDVGLVLESKEIHHSVSGDAVTRVWVCIQCPLGIGWIREEDIEPV